MPASGAPPASPRPSEAWERTEQTGMRRAEALYVLGMAEYLSVSGDYVGHIRAATTDARAISDVNLELKARSLQDPALESLGDSAAAYALNTELIAKAERHWLRGIEAILRGCHAHLEIAHRGDYAAAIEVYKRLLARPATLGPAVSAAEALYVIALADTSRGAEARAVVKAALTRAENPADRLFVLWAGGECEWLDGHIAQACDLARRALAAHEHNLNRIMVALTLNRAAVEVGCARVWGSTPASNHRSMSSMPREQHRAGP